MTVTKTPTPTFRLVGVAALVAAIGIGAAAWLLPGLRTTMAQATSKATPAPIDGDRAYGYLKAICKVGPHPAGSAANARVRAMVAEHFKKLGGQVREQPVSGNDPISNNPVVMANLIGSWFPERTDRVVLGAHYDTRPFPDEDPDPIKRKQPFLGANDPGSGIALLMEIAHHLADSNTPWGVDLVLFDGEELVYGGGQDQRGEYFFGSKAFAKAYAERAKNAPRYVAGIVFDMVGGKDLKIEKEQYSIEFANRLVNDVWGVARSLKIPQFRDRVGMAVYDDHLPLNNGGIPSIDIIHFPYRHWHTASDIPENCSGESLAQVGKVVTAWLNKPKPRGR
ncbi:M28 family peptidase [Tundrisphaera lichenicola]|uniref:M28 family peptidase n=1 Tax=Tundrisphaera lichenicola TaxID=2029860 RepID=UPI003EB6C112